MKVDLSELKSIPQGKWDALAKKKIYFGHQSVGYNIMEGVENIVRQMPEIKLNIRKAISAEDFNEPVFAHSPVGQNKDPYSKIDGFKKLMESGIADKVDIAFFKFCYVDIVKDTDLDDIFSYYSKVLTELQNKYPNVKFIHCTVPLNATPQGIRTKIKRLLGKNTWTDEDNISRNLFNNRLKEKYGGGVFDIALYEATKLDGSINSFNQGDKAYLSMVSEYTTDGGHLNEVGQLLIAERLIKFLLKI